MAFVVADRVKETTTTTGTGTVTLAGAASGYQSFSAVGNGNTTFYCIAGQSLSEWEVGIGTYTASGTTLSRDTILASSNSGSAVNFSAGTKDVFVTYPAGKAIFQNNLDSVVVAANTSSDALRITQTGTGNALLVEDSANPDATPFVVDASGNVVVGATSASGALNATTYALQQHGPSAGGSSFAQFNSSPTASSAAGLFQAKSNSGGAVANGDRLGQWQVLGHDGTSFVSATMIRTEVDGTPGTNDMPGRLVFSTTADGASSATERMRIDNQGRVGIGATPTAVTQVLVSRPMTGNATQVGIQNSGQLRSDATGNVRYYLASSSTEAASFTTTAISLYDATQGTFGAGSTVTNQYGFNANSSLTGATNNYGFYSNIASGTGRWNFYANGTAANYFAGDMQLDKTVTATGTTGAQTINKNAGTVNFAAAATSLVVTDSRVTANSIIICTVGTNDTTMKSVAAVAGAGSFTLHANAAATAETRVNFLIIN